MSTPILYTAKRLLAVIIKLGITAGILILILFLMPSDVVNDIKKHLPGEFGSAPREINEITVVYSNDRYAKEQAERLVDLLSEKPSLYVRVVKENVFSWSSKSEDNDLTVFLGHTTFTPEAYLKSISRIGEMGYEISFSFADEEQAGNAYVTAFSSGTLSSAVSAFSEQFLRKEGTINASNLQYCIEEKHVEGELPDLVVVEDETPSLAVFSYPGTDDYTLKAISALVEKTSVDSVLFNNADALGNDRNTIGESWTKIFNATSNAPLTFINSIKLGNEGGLVEEVINTVAGGKGKYVKSMQSVMMVDKYYYPIALDFLVPDFEESETQNIISVIEKFTALADRANNGSVPVVLNYTALPGAVESKLPAPSGYEPVDGCVISESLKPYVDTKFDSVYYSALECGVRHFVFSAGYTNTGVFYVDYNDSEVAVALSGSIGFDEPGVGGKFALNNSLRGMILVSLNKNLNGEFYIGMNYVFAADYGLTVKNAK